MKIPKIPGDVVTEILVFLAVAFAFFTLGARIGGYL